MLYIIIIISEWHGEKSLNLIFWDIDRVTNPWYQLFALMMASSSMQSDLAGRYLNSGWNTDPQSLFISIYLLTYLFILTNSLRGSWKTVFDWYRDLNKRALLLKNSVNLTRWINYSSLSNLLRKTHQSPVMCQYVIKLTGYWILLMNVGKATFQSLMLENDVGLFTELLGVTVGGFLCARILERRSSMKWTQLTLRQSDLILRRYINSYTSKIPWARLKEKEWQM